MRRFPITSFSSLASLNLCAERFRHFSTRIAKLFNNVLETPLVVCFEKVIIKFILTSAKWGQYLRCPISAEILRAPSARFD
jgi:hypothetical protein